MRLEARQEWQPTPVFLPGESLDRVAESDITDTHTHTHGCFHWREHEVRGELSCLVRGRVIHAEEIANAMHV